MDPPPTASGRGRPRPPRGRRRASLATAALAWLAVACGGSSFDPTTPCTADGRAAGAYPALEALVPGGFEGRPPDRLDSGRNCSPNALGSLVTHQVAELRFAGGTWDLGGSNGVSLVVLEAEGLQAAWVAEFYESGARAGRRTEDVRATSDVLPDGRTAARVDTLNGESFQTVLVWGDGDHVRVVIVASFIREVETKAAHEAVVDAAAAATIAAKAPGTEAIATRPSRLSGI